MKIAITSDIYYPMTNGVAVFAHNLAVGLAKRGHEVIVICPSFTGKKHKEKRDGVTTYYLTSIRFPFYPDQINPVSNRKTILYRYGIWWATAAYPEMHRIVKKFQPDIIHNQTAEPVALAAQHCARHFNIPLVTTGHAHPDSITGQFKAPEFIKKPINALLRVYMASFLKHGEYATMPTELAIDDLVPKNRKHFKVPVEPLSNGIDLSCYNPGKANLKIYNKYKLPTDRPIILSVGRVDPEKKVGTIVEAFARALNDIPNAMLVIVGDGTDRPHLLELVSALGIEDSVKFLGRVLLPDIAEIYKTGTVFVNASEMETQGIVLIEAAATGLPIIAVDKMAAREVCQDGKNGILCKSGDLEGMYRAIVKIVTDEELQRKYSAGSLVVAEKHDINNTLSRFEDIYSEAIHLKSIK